MALTQVPTGMIADASVTPTKLSQPLTLASSQATTSGTSIDFTSIPSWVKRITVMLNGVSTNGTSPPQLQLGSGSVQTTGYVSYNTATVTTTISGAAFTAGIGLGVSTGNWSAASVIGGPVVLTLQSGNTWVASGNLAAGAGAMYLTSGYVTLSGTLDRVRLTTANGTDAFDAGSVNILYE